MEAFAIIAGTVLEYGDKMLAWLVQTKQQRFKKMVSFVDDITESEMTAAKFQFLFRVL